MAAVAASCEQSDQGPTAVHQETGLVFPRELPSTSDGKTAETLLGLGLRRVTLLFFKVYVIGFYMPTDPRVKAQLAPADGKKLSMGELTERIIVSQEIPKSLRIVSCYYIAGSHLRDGLGRSLEKFLPKDKARRAEFEKEIARFKTFFPKGQIEKGQAMTFSLAQGKVVVSFEGEKAGEIDSLFITENLVRAYIGEQPVTKEAKKSIVQGLQGAFSEILAEHVK